LTKRRNNPKQVEWKAHETISASLDECLKDMATRFDLPAGELIIAATTAPYAEKRMEGLNYPDATGTPDERRVWYALARVLKPAHIVEVGVLWGVSTIQWLSALRDNGAGHVDAVDILNTIEGGRKPGHLIPDVLRNRLTLHIGTPGETYFSADKPPIDLFFEDASHEYESTKAIHEAAKVQLAPNALCVAHDPISRPEIQRAFLDADIMPTIYRINDSNYGLAIWRNQ
jgi:predicted O-methyltransferase YrrM